MTRSAPRRSMISRSPCQLCSDEVPKSIWRCDSPPKSNPLDSERPVPRIEENPIWLKLIAHLTEKFARGDSAFCAAVQNQSLRVFPDSCRSSILTERPEDSNSRRRTVLDLGQPAESNWGGVTADLLAERESGEGGEFADRSERTHASLSLATNYSRRSESPRSSL